MKGLLILLLLNYASSDKLDLTYLPPPGSQYSGGRPGDIQTPLEYPKDSYSTTFRPQVVPFGQKVPTPDDYKATIGINRGVPPQVPGSFVPLGSKGSLNKFQNSYNVPTTTVSYAFTQTTTHPPSENFETTLSPINPITGLPITTDFNIPSQEVDQAYRGNNNQFRPNVPGYQQTVNIIDDQQPTSGVVPQLPGSMIPNRNGQIYEGQNQPEVYQTQQGFQQSNSGKRPAFVSQVPFEQAQYPINQNIAGDYNRQPSIIPSTTVSQDLLPVVTDDLNTNNVQGFTTLSPDISKNFNQSPNTYHPDSRFQSNQNQYSPLDNQVSPQQYSGNGDLNANDLSKQYEQFPNIPTTISTQGFVNKQIPTNGLVPSGITKYIQKPERPQAESDRNAVILNYKNVITPDGFEYSFDTSNGIHMDENGTAIGGVKAEGSYSYTGDDGKVYTVVYTADENGYQPHGDHLPTPPPIPEVIQRLIEKANREKEAGIIHDGSYDEEKYGYKTYQGPTKHRPIQSDIITKYGTVSGLNVPKKYPSSHGSAIKSFTKSQQGSNKIPTDEFKSSDDFNNYDKPQEEYEEDQSVGDEIIKANNKNVLTPGSRRPGYNIDSKQDEQFFKDKKFQNVIKQRPFKNNQYPTIENEDDSSRYISNNEFPRFPSSQEQKTKLGGVDRIQKPGFKDDSGAQQFVRRPVIGVNNDNIDTQYDFEEQRQPDYKYLSRPSTDHFLVGDKKTKASQPSYVYENDQFGNVDNNNRLSSEYPANKIKSMPSPTEDYASSTEIPSRFKPGGINRPTTKTNFEQTISTRRRPSRPGLIVNENIAEYNQGSLDDISSEYNTENYDESDDALATTSVYEKTQDGYDSSVDLKSQDIQPTIINRPQTYVTKKPPQFRDRGRKPQASVENELEKEYDNVQYGQTLRGKPSQNVESKKFSNNTGYQYIPPRNKFNYVEGNKFSTRYPLSQSTTRRPFQKLTHESKDSTTKPFLTPNVSRVGIVNSENDYNEESVAESERLPNQYNEKLNKNYERYTTPGEVYSSDVISSNRPTSQPTTKLSSPNYRITQYDKQYSTPSPFKTTSQGTPQTFQQIYKGQDLSTQTPYETYSSTPTSASRRPTYYDTPVKDISNPNQSNGYYTEDIDDQRISGNNGINPSTSVPHSNSGFGKPRPGGSTVGEYQTTYSPTQATTPEYQYSEAITTLGSPTTRPTTQTVSKIPGNIYGNLPSTTYRPGYTISGVEQTPSRRPVSQVDDVRRPSVNFEQQGQQYTPAVDGSLPVYGQTTRYKYEPNSVEIKKPGSGQDQMIKNYQSSSERIIGEDFSGPKQQQRFDPKLGYYY